MRTGLSNGLGPDRFCTDVTNNTSKRPRRTMMLHFAEVRFAKRFLH